MRLLVILSTVSLLTSAVLAATTTTEIEEDERTELQNTINCKSVCEDCNCRGFYCGEECICECNSDDDEDVKCLTTMQNKCKKLNFPFEVLIQGKTGNRFMRNVLLFEQIYRESLKYVPRNRRSTISVYKPPANRVRRQLSLGFPLQDRKNGHVSSPFSFLARKVDHKDEEERTPVAAIQTVQASQTTEQQTTKPQSTTSQLEASQIAAPETALHQIKVPQFESSKVVNDTLLAANPIPQAAETLDSIANAPPIGLPLAIALPAIRAQNLLTSTAIKAKYEAAFAKLRARLAARRQMLNAAALTDVDKSLSGPAAAAPASPAIPQMTPAIPQITPFQPKFNSHQQGFSQLPQGIIPFQPFNLQGGDINY